MVDKNEIRRKLRDIRSGLSLEQVSLLSAKIQKRVIETDAFKNAKNVSCYSNIPKFCEVETDLLIDACLNSRKILSMPVIHEDGVSLIHRKVDSTDSLIQNKWGVREPVDGEIMNPADMDLVIVPMVGADYQRNRMGYGKGFYDRFLSQTKAIKIGLCYECCMIDALPTEPHDIKMDMIITEG